MLVLTVLSSVPGGFWGGRVRIMLYFSVEVKCTWTLELDPESPGDTSSLSFPSIQRPRGARYGGTALTWAQDSLHGKWWA